MHSSMLHAFLLSKSEPGGISGATYHFVELANKLTKLIPALFADELTDLANGADNTNFETDEYIKKLLYAGSAHIDALYNDLVLLTDQDTNALNVSFDGPEANQGLIQLAVQYSRLRQRSPPIGSFIPPRSKAPLPGHDRRPRAPRRYGRFCWPWQPSLIGQACVPVSCAPRPR